MKKNILLLSFIILIFGCKKSPTKSIVKTPEKTEHQIIFEIRESLFKELQAKPNQNIFIGHSLIQYANWDELIPNENIENRGIGGAFIPDITKILASQINSKPKAIFLMAGINDIGNNIPVEKIKSDYLELFSLMKKNPNVKFYYLSILPSNPERLSIIKELNSFAQNQCTDNITYIDVFTPFSESDGTFIKKYTIDDVHLSGRGYIKLSEILKPLL